MAINIQSFFNQQLPAAMASNPAAFQHIGAKYEIGILGDSGGEWFVDASASGPSCNANALLAGTTADATIRIASEDFQKLIENPKANFMQLFFAGKVKMTGNVQLAMKLPDLLTLALS